MYVHRVSKLYRGLFIGKYSEFEIIRYNLEDLTNLIQSSISLKDEGEIIIYEIDLKTKEEKVCKTFLVCNELYDFNFVKLMEF